MNELSRRAIAVLIGGALIASACGSGGDATSEVATAQTAASTTPVPTTEAPTTTVERLPGENVVIEGEDIFDQTGTWKVVEGADVLGCDGGTLTGFNAQDQFAQELTCSGDREGSFVGRFSPAGSGPTFTSNWDVIVASGDFDDLTGDGTWIAEMASDGASSTFTLTLGATFGDVAAPTSTFHRLSQWQETECADGFVTWDGLVEYATVNDTMFRLDLVTREKTEHGVPPAECAWWFGDSELGRRVALSVPWAPLPDGMHKVWLGPYDGEWDVELEFDEVTLLLSRSMTADRLIFSHPDSGTVFMLDATTGAQLGEDIDGNFADGRNSLALATSADGRLIALGGANAAAGGTAGMLLILDAESGAEIARLETDAPPTAVAFDADGTAIVAGLFTGQVITVDAASFEIINEVNIGATTKIGELGIRPDGLIVVWTEEKGLVVDRLTGPTGAEVIWRHSAASNIRPDGSINSLTAIQTFEVYEIEN